MIAIKKDNSGVFSNFLRVLDWTWYHHYTGDPIYIDWEHNGENLFDYFFNQKFDKPAGEYVETFDFVERSKINLNPKIELRRNKIPYYKKYVGDATNTMGGYFYCNPTIYGEPEFYLLREELNMIFNTYFSFSDNFLQNSFLPLYNTQKILGVHLRSPQHYVMNCSNLPEFYLVNAKYTYEYMQNNGYEYIYVASDMLPFFEALKMYIKEENILCINYNRLAGLNDDWVAKTHSMSDEIKNVLLDVVNMTRCTELIGGSGNVFIATLLLNPTIKYHLYPNLLDKHSN